MAKDKKAQALKVPKRVAGIKVPKKIRKSANKAIAIAENPQARELAVAALTAAAAALGKKGFDAARDGEAGRGEAAGFEDVKQQAARLSDVVIAAALEGARRLLDGLQAPAAAQKAPAPKPKRVRSSGRAPEPAEGPADA